MKKWLARSKDQRGTTFPLIIAVTLACLLILYGIMEFLRLSLIASGVKGALQDAVVVVVNDNYANVYRGVRGGYSGGYHAEGYGLGKTMDTDDIYYHPDETLGTQRGGGGRVKHTGGASGCKITGLDVIVRNAPLAPLDPTNAQQFEADAVVWLKVLVWFAGKAFPPIKMKLKVQAGYIEVF